jgi:hypothetical protein
MGNLSEHTINDHCGKSFYLNIATTQVFLYDAPKIYIISSLYYDDLGLAFNKNSVKFDKYLLDQKSI